MATSANTLLCDTCQENNEYINAEVLCKECRELYCSDCLKRHKTFKATKDHVTVKINQPDADENPNSADCDTCFEFGQGQVSAVSLCVDCRELYCDPCKKRHMTFKATKNHEIRDIGERHVQNIPIPVAPIATLSSDFEGFMITPDSSSAQDDQEVLCAQVPVLNVCDKEQNTAVDRDRETEKRASSGSICRDKFSRDSITGDKVSAESITRDKISVDSIATFSGKTKSDSKSCFFTGIICLGDGRIILLDKQNKKLKMFSQSFKLVCEESTKVKGLGLTRVSDTELAVLVGKTVDFYIVRGEQFVRQNNVFKLDANGYSISHSGDVYAITCNIVDKDPYIKICSDSGQEVHRIWSFKERPGYSVNLSTDNDSLYLSSWKENKFTCLSQKGELKWEIGFGGENVVEIDNRLLVTSRVNHAVALCTKDGRYKKTIIKDGDIIPYPNSIAYDARTQQLFVTRCQSKDDNIVTVIKLAF